MNIEEQIEQELSNSPIDWRLGLRIHKLHLFIGIALKDADSLSARELQLAIQIYKNYNVIADFLEHFNHLEWEYEFNRALDDTDELIKEFFKKLQ